MAQKTVSRNFANLAIDGYGAWVELAVSCMAWTRRKPILMLCVRCFAV